MSTQAPAPTTWDDIANGVSAFLNAAAPLLPVAEDVVQVAFPGAGAALSLGEKILQGVVAAEPSAVALYKQVTSGTPPTPAQLAQYASDYEASYQQLKADIATQIAALPPGS
jgi:hypothetical protein